MFFSEQAFYYVQIGGDVLQPAALPVVAWGEVSRGEGALDDFVAHVEKLGLPSKNLLALLEPDEYQILQIEAPNVPAPEMRAAARWRVKDLADTHIDDLTIDVLKIEDESARVPQMLAIAARNAATKALVKRLESAAMTPRIIDIPETGLRNLQTAAAKLSDREARASAMLTVTRANAPSLLTISAKGELFFTRRFDIDLANLATSLLPEANTPRFVIELQRSLDLWDRTYGNLPLDRLYVEAGGHSDTLIERLRLDLALNIERLPLNDIFSFGNTKPLPADNGIYLPLLGSLLRVEEVKL